MGRAIRFAVIGDCHYSWHGNYATRDCAGAKDRLTAVIDRLNGEELDFVMSLGDLGDGHYIEEVPQMLEVYAQSSHPVHFAVGNHDLCRRNAAEFAKICGMPAPRYDFTAGNIRFIVLNAFENSRYVGRNSPEGQAYWRYREERPWLKLQEWPGFMTEPTWDWLEETLNDAAAKGQEIIVFSHVPSWFLACGNDNRGTSCRIIDHQRFFELLDRYPRVRAYIAGHHHPGGLAVRRGVLHKTMRSVCDNAEPTCCIFEADADELRVTGVGAETDYIHRYELTDSHISGTAPAGSIVMTNCGALTKVGGDGCFTLPVPMPGKYCLKAVAEGMADVFVPHVKAPADGIGITMTPDPENHLYTGSTGGYAMMQITDDSEPVRWFDVAGTHYGSIKPDMNVWNDHTTNYYSAGDYAFTAKGKVSVRVEPRHPAMKEAGWYRGDLHAHLIHGENLYIGNVMESAFIGRAENYDWLYMARRHGNDGEITDVHAAAEKLSDSGFFYRMNEEFPKARCNHFGNAGVDFTGTQYDSETAFTLDPAEYAVWDHGGVTVPVHPFYGHMAFRQLCLWLLLAPEKMPCIDFFYCSGFPKQMAEGYWYMLLDRGYEIGCFSTSDAAFDVGRTPARVGRGATYLKLDSLDEPSIVDAILHRRTSVTFDAAALLFDVDGSISGDHLPADGKPHTLHVRAYWKAGRRAVLHIVKNSADLAQETIVFTADEEPADFTMTVSMEDNGWILPILYDMKGSVCAAASPVFFRNGSFVKPEVLPRPKRIPLEIIAECEALTPEELSDPALIEHFADELREVLRREAEADETEKNGETT